MSSGTPPLNGWALSSSRPASKSKPSSVITSRLSARCAAFGNGPRGAIDRLARLPLADGAHQARQPVTAGRRTARSTSALVMPGSYWSISASYGARPVASAQVLRLLAGKAQHLAQVDEKAGPVVGRPLRCARRARSARSRATAPRPALPAARSTLRQLAPDLAQVGALGVVERLVLGARRAGRRGAARCAGGAAARPSRPAPRRAPRCPWPASSPRGPSWRSTAGGRSGAAGTSGGRARRRRRSSWRCERLSAAV